MATTTTSTPQLIRRRDRICYCKLKFRVRFGGDVNTISAISPLIG
ncbi:hypothetical protein BVRB_7g161850 [Beta vulgaris subsp. vulgaris]|nr:hypothetical protein BVRB_7g161850 [Beta vulgaris subsp. vulgaris]